MPPQPTLLGVEGCIENILLEPDRLPNREIWYQGTGKHVSKVHVRVIELIFGPFKLPGRELGPRSNLQQANKKTNYIS